MSQVLKLATFRAPLTRCIIYSQINRHLTTTTFTTPTSAMAAAAPAPDRKHPVTSSSPIYMEEMYESWLQDPKSVHESWNEYFHQQNFEEFDGFSDNSLREIDDRLSVQDIIRAHQTRDNLVGQLNSLNVNIASICSSMAKGSLDNAAIKTTTDTSSELGTGSFNDGLQHKGRLNIIANVCRKPLENVFSQMSGSKPTDKSSGDDKASPAQLAELEKTLVHCLPKFFTNLHPIDIYTKDVVFIDNIRNIRTQGIAKYHTQITLFKVFHSIKYTRSRLELLNLVKNQEESCLKIRWRIVCNPGLFRGLFSIKHFLQSGGEIWKDGISTMHVNRMGKIYCHVCDNIDVETEDIKQKKAIKNPLINRGLSVNVKQSSVT